MSISHLPPPIPPVLTSDPPAPILCPECEHDIDMHEADPVSPGCQDFPADFDELMVPVDGTCTCGLIPSEIARKLLAKRKAS